MVAGARRALAVEAAAPAREFALEAFVFLVDADRAALAFSTILDSMLVAAAEREPFVLRGEPGRLGEFLVGEVV